MDTPKKGNRILAFRIKNTPNIDPPPFLFTARKSVISKIANGPDADDLIENICYGEYDNATVVNPNMKNYEWNTFRKNLEDTSQPCSEMLIYCRFALEKFDCMKLFDSILSDEGV